MELFFFDKEFGIQPPPPGKISKKGSQEYPEWRKRAKIVEDIEVKEDRLGLHLAIFVGPAQAAIDRGRLLVQNEAGEIVKTVDLATLAVLPTGFCHVPLDPNELPDPVEVVHETAMESRIVLGPCLLETLEDQLEGNELEAAGKTAFGPASEGG